MEISEKPTRKSAAAAAAAPDRSAPPGLANAHSPEAQPPARKKPRRSSPPPPSAAAITTAQKRTPRRLPVNRPVCGGGDGVGVGGGRPPRCVGILAALLRQGVTRPTWILRKEVSGSDVSSQQSRLLLTSGRVASSPLPGLITPAEAALVRDRHRGLPVRVLDRLGREHAMVFKFLTSNGDFRLIGSWSRFVRLNGLRAGDRLEMWAFRLPDGLGMALLNYDKSDEVPGGGGDDDDDDKDGDDDDKLNEDEMVAVEALVALQDS